MKYKCSGCDYETDTKSSVLSHLNKQKKCKEDACVIVNEGETLKCNICGIEMSNAFNLRRHTVTCEKKVTINLDTIYHMIAKVIETQEKLLKRMDDIEEKLKPKRSKDNEPEKVPNPKLKLSDRVYQCNGVKHFTVFCPESKAIFNENIKKYEREQNTELETIQVSIGTKKSIKYFASFSSKSIEIELEDGNEMYYFDPVNRTNEKMKGCKDLFVHLPVYCTSEEGCYKDNESNFYCFECACNYGVE